MAEVYAWRIVIDTAGVTLSKPFLSAKELAWYIREELLKKTPAGSIVQVSWYKCVPKCTELDDS